MGTRRTSFSFLFLSFSLWPVMAQDAPTGIVKAGAVALIRADGKASGTAFTTENFVAGFTQTDYTNYTPPPPAQTTTVGPCILGTYTPPVTGLTPPVVTFLDAGPAMNLSGPNGTKTFPATVSKSSISYGGQLGGGIAIPIPGFPPPAPLFLDPGTYTVDNGPGGADIGPFSASLTIPSPAFAWTNADADSVTTVVRSAGVDLLWTGGDPNANVIIQGAASVLDPATFKVTSGGSFSCVVPNTGEFFVSADVLATIPATPATALPGTSTLSVGTGLQVNLNAPGTDLSLFSFQAGGSRNVQYQ